MCKNLIVLLTICVLSWIASADVVVISNNTSITPDDILFTDQDVVVNGCTVTLEGHIQFNSVQRQL